jgi:malate synthase
MAEMRTIEGIEVAGELADFVETQALPGTGVEAGAFWRGLAELVNGFGPENRALLVKREEIQARIDAWHVENRGKPHDHEGDKAVLGASG